MEEENDVAKFRTGQRVSYKVGKGRSTGRITNVSEGKATLQTENGHTVYRMVSKLETVTTSPAEAPVTP